MIALCTYPLDGCDANNILDVVNAHQFALTRRNGEWKIIEDQGQKKARKALLESEEKFRQLAEISPAAIIIYQGESVVYVNPAAEMMTGYKLEEFLKMKPWDIVHPDYRKLIKEKTSLRMKGVQLSEHYDVKLVTKDGRELWTSNSTAAIKYMGKPAGLVNAIDITERKQAEEALRESEEKLRCYYELPLIGMALTSIEKGWLQANDEICRILGYSRDELFRMRWDEITYPDDLDNDLELFDQLLSGEIDNYMIEKRFVRKNGEVIPTQISIGCIRNPDKSVRYIVGLMQDITERKRAEVELRNAKLQAELYLDLMGHDINNMHQIALGYLELARDMHPEAGESEFLNKPIEVLQRSAQLIKNVRKLQKLSDGMFQIQDVDVGKVLADVKREFGAVPQKVVTLNLNGCDHCQVRANELLHDVFANLVGNAIKHTGDRAEILINLKLAEENGHIYCSASVEDNGPGIPDDNKGTIFNRTLKGTSKTKGMGLGLYLVRSLVESYNGKVWVEDRVPGDHTKGAKFVVMLPAVEK